MLVCWEKPELGVLKLNFDGASKANPGVSGGRAILRNDEGEMIFAISNMYGIQLNIAAELWACLDGLKKVKELDLNLYPLHIESDSTFVMEVLSGNYKVGWHLWYYWHEIQTFF